MNTLILAKILLSFLFLSFASYQDLKRREVDDRVWLSMILFGVLFALFESFSIGNFSPLERSFLAIGACFFIALIITSFNLFGGADGMALIGIGAMIPKFEREFIFFLFPLSVFNNALLCVLVLPLILLSYNLMRKSKISNVKASTLKRDIAYFLGYPIKTENLDFRVFPLEFIEKDEKVLRLFTRDLDYDYEKHREEFLERSINEIWVTYGIPFIFVITLGFLLTLIFGDLILRLVFEFL